MNKTFEDIDVKLDSTDNFLEMARVTNIKKKKMGLKQGMTIIVYTREDKENGVEPYFYLFPYISEKLPNISDLITKVKIIQSIPKDIDDVVSIDGDLEVPFEYKAAILKWANDTNKMGNNNWKFLQYIWNLNQNEEVFPL